ncbi:MAG TPA: hypothetical protein VJ302_36870 [Blastocatellia bacterium]|nr:hypothetical protein [Blastocatellia bacterium]
MNYELLKLTIEQAMGLTLSQEQFDKITDRMNNLVGQGLNTSDAIQVALEMELPPDESELSLN